MDLFGNPWGNFVNDMAKDAVAFSKSRGIPNPHVNAIAHTYVSADLVYDTATKYAAGSSPHLGGNWPGEKAKRDALADAMTRAEKLGNIKESFTHPVSDPNPKDTLKDQYNNEIGRQIGAYAFRNDLTKEQMHELIDEAYKTGVIARDEEDPRIDKRPSWTVTKDFAAAALNKCFAAGTLITLHDGLDVPVETIQPGDVVASFNDALDAGRGALIGRRVVRTFVNENQIVIDFHGTRVTPGHAYLCGDGPHEGRFRQIMNIVRDDGAVVLADGSLMRAATGCAVGSPGDAFVEIQIARPARHRETGESVTLLKERGRVRAGTRVRKLDGSFVSFLDLVEANGWTLHADGLVGQGPGHAPEPLLWAGPSIPKPEDYILVLSQLTLADLYGDPQQAERPGLPLSHRQGQGEANAVVLHAAPSREGAEPGANDGSARTLVRRARNLLAAKRPRPHRVPKQAGETVH